MDHGLQGQALWQEWYKLQRLLQKEHLYHRKRRWDLEVGSQLRAGRELVFDIMYFRDKLLQYQLIPDQRIIVCHMKDGKSVISYSDDYFQTMETMQANALGFF